MPAPSTEAVSLPRERVQQLRNYTAASGARSMGEALGLLLRSQGLCQHDFPGVEVRRLADGLVVKIEDNDHLGLSFEQARHLAATLRDVAALKIKGYVNIDEDWAIERRGLGVKITLPFSSGKPKTYSLDLAHELAELIEHAASEAVTS